MTLFEIVSSSPEVTGALGTSPVRFFPFGRSPHDCVAPYATYQLVGGQPINTLTTPCSDRHSYQIDVLAGTQKECDAVARSIRDVIQSEAYVTGYNVSAMDKETALWRVSFDVDMISAR